MCSSLSELTSEDLIVVDEKDLGELVKQDATHLPTVVICSNSTRSQAASRRNMPAITEFVSKPFGPYKLAKAFRLCLDKARDYRLGLTPVITFSSEGPPEADIASPDLEHMTLETEDVLHPLNVQTNGIVTASDTENAHMAIDPWNIDSANGTSGDVTVIDGQNFPFPDQSQQGQSGTNPTPPRSPQNGNIPLRHLTRRESGRPPLISRVTEPAWKTAFPHSPNLPSHGSSAVTKNGETATLGTEPPSIDNAKAQVVDGWTSSDLTVSNLSLHDSETPNETPGAKAQEQEKRPPRLLLVDDNKINLRLLETYMRKRKYTLVDSAENGQLAVQAAESHEHGYDIIFLGKSHLLPPPHRTSSLSPLSPNACPSRPVLTPPTPTDISMPIMNGFEATRAIRDIEESRARATNLHPPTTTDATKSNSTEPSPPTPHALIIALTGLASSRDQTEAFTSGVDLFMTKPVSFKEVGRLLDNWEAHAHAHGHAGGKENISK